MENVYAATYVANPVVLAKAGATNSLLTRRTNGRYRKSTNTSGIFSLALKVLGAHIHSFIAPAWILWDNMEEVGLTR